MKPTIQIASTRTPDGEVLLLQEHDGDFSLVVNRYALMTSRAHESELELARLGCSTLIDRKEPAVLIGGLGLGYTLRQTLDLLGPKATVVVAELIPAVVKWNREFVGELTGHPLRDRRVVVKTANVADIIAKSTRAFDAILIDIDNGPNALTDAQNETLYSRAGIRACREALRERGCLAVWSSTPDSRFTRLLEQERFHTHFFRVPAHKGGKARSRCIWVASQHPNSLPPLPPRLPRREKRKPDTAALESTAAPLQAETE